MTASRRPVVPPQGFEPWTSALPRLRSCVYGRFLGFPAVSQPTDFNVELYSGPFLPFHAHIAVWRAGAGNVLENGVWDGC